MKPLKFVVIAITLICTAMFANAQSVKFVSPKEKLAKLENSFSGKIGIYAIDTNSGEIISYQANKLFPIQSTFKLIGVSALLKKSEYDKKLLHEKIHYTKKDLTFWYPVTGRYVQSGITFRRLAEAAISYSDDTAINLIMKKLGGPKSITAFAHQTGNKTFNLEHYEPNLNSNPKNTNDSSTPKDMALSVMGLTLGNFLKQPQRKQLVLWMRNNTTGYKRIRAGVPIGWVVADKTGSGRYGVANDIGIVWSPACKPIVLAIYAVQQKCNARGRSDIVAKATSIVLNAFSKVDSCFAATSLA